MPIREEFEDYYAWHYDGKGEFSVKSAYQVYVRARDSAAVAESSELVQGDIEWKKIWTVPCQPKVQQFIWRLAHNSLPLKLNIKRMGMECDTRCLCCRRLDEDGSHLFIKCKEVKKLWREVELEAFRQRLDACNNAREVVQALFTLSEDDQVLIACMVWKWWDRRNKLNVGDKVSSVEATSALARTWALESLQINRKEQMGQPDRPVSRWTKPDGDMLKINIDGAFHGTSGSGG